MGWKMSFLSIGTIIMMFLLYISRVIWGRFVAFVCFFIFLPGQPTGGKPLVKNPPTDCCLAYISKEAYMFNPFICIIHADDETHTEIAFVMAQGVSSPRWACWDVPFKKKWAPR